VGQRIEAAVVSRPETDVDPAELREFTMRALRSSKTPDRFWLLDALPRTETGKLLRRQVPSLIEGREGLMELRNSARRNPRRSSKGVGL
jgi:acyl-CoA synthetase (AMP-forming)/AMP-acid ligase II